jgi:hypothetical protein
MNDRNGWMTVQIVPDPKPAVPHSSSREGFWAAASSEKVAVFNGYYAYFGTWTVHPSGATVHTTSRNRCIPEREVKRVFVA